MLVFGIVLLMSFVVSVSALPDLTISRLEKVLNNKYYNEDHLLVLKFCHKNIGTSVSQAVSIEASYFINNLSTNSGALQSGEADILNAGEEKCGSWPMDGFSLSLLNESNSVTFRFTLDPENKMEESNKMNNIREISYSADEIAMIKETKPLTEEEISEEIVARNLILSQFFIDEDFLDWTYHPGFIYYNQSSPCLSENFIQYSADYIKNLEDEAVAVLILDFPSEIENQKILEDLIRCNVQQNINLQSKTFSDNTYIFAKIPQTSTLSDGTQRTFNTDHLLWYNGKKIVYLMYYGNSFNFDIGKQILSAYFEKYPSELVAPPNLFQKILDFFRRLFGAE